MIPSCLVHAVYCHSISLHSGSKSLSKTRMEQGVDGIIRFARTIVSAIVRALHAHLGHGVYMAGI